MRAVKDDDDDDGEKEDGNYMDIDDE